MSRKINKIRTGGQSGVDRAALDVARELNIEICGWCPNGGWAEDYTTPPGLLSDYPELTETPSAGTTQRTLWNMRDADAILTIIPRDSGKSEGTEVGVREGEHLHKPMFTASGIEDTEAVIRWLDSLPEELDLSIGGPRASECPNAYEVTRMLLIDMLSKIRAEEQAKCQETI